MIRSPFSASQECMDEIPLSPETKGTMPESFSPKKQIYTLESPIVLRCHHSEIPEADSDYYPRDIATRRLFKQHMCEKYDCDCRSDGCAGCLRRNKQCLCTALVVFLSVTVVLLLFSSLTYNLTRKYGPPSESSTEPHLRFHLHYVNRSKEEQRQAEEDLVFNENILEPITIIEDSRDPNIFEASPPYESMWASQETISKGVQKVQRSKREARENTDIYDNNNIENLPDNTVLVGLKGVKQKLLSFKTELNEIETSLQKSKRQKSTYTAFQPYSVTNPMIKHEDSIETSHTDKLVSSTGIFSDFSDDGIITTTEIPEENISSTDSEVITKSKPEEEFSDYNKNLFYDDLDADITDTEDERTLENFQTSEFPDGEGVSTQTIVTSRAEIVDEVRSHEIIKTEPNLFDYNMVTEIPSSTKFPNDNNRGNENFVNSSDMSAYKFEENEMNNEILSSEEETEHEQIYTLDKKTTPSDFNSQTTTDSADLLSTLGETDIYTLKMQSSTDRKEDAQHSIDPEYKSEVGSDFGKVNNTNLDLEENDISDSEDSQLNLPSSRLDGRYSSDEKSETVSEYVNVISLDEAKRNLKDSKKKSLINSRIVGALNEDNFPTGSGMAKPIYTGVETTKTGTQKISFTPTGISQYLFPYQMCFFANPSLRGRPFIRRSDARTFNFSPDHTFPSLPKYEPFYKQENAVPAQQNYFTLHINNYPNAAPSVPYPLASSMPYAVPPTTGSVFTFPSQQQLPQLFNNRSQPTQSPFFCTSLLPPLLQNPSLPGTPEFSHTRCEDCDSGEVIAQKKPDAYGRDIMCPRNSVACRDASECVLIEHWCDNKVHCKDASDEAFCSCRERLNDQRICDGYYDCPGGEDEVGCFDCPKAAFSCGAWTGPDMCIPLSKRCDGVKDCPTGKDEENCAALFPNIIANDTYGISYTRGFLHRNWRGSWIPVCVDFGSSSWAEEACTNELEILKGEPTGTYEQVPDYYKGSFLARKEDGIVELQHHCKGHVATYVKCPAMMCGTRIHKSLEKPNEYESRLRRFISHKELNKLVSVGNTGRIEAKGPDPRIKRQETGRVVGGTPSKPRAWPWVIALYKDGHFHCGGVILDEKWIMTAAHCLSEYWKHYYEVRAGILRRFSFSPMEQSRTVSDVILHEKYDSDNMSNDIALLRLQRPLRLNRWVRPTCLPGEESKFESWKVPTPGTLCVAVGWGAVKEHGFDPDQMREVEIPILPTCRHKEDRDIDAICAGVKQGGRDTCQGDSGGPLLCRSLFDSERWYAAGIVSHGKGCARPNEPGAYTRVSILVDWITANSNDFFLPNLKPIVTCPGIKCASASKRCIPSKNVCNGYIDCLDGEDEKDCASQSSEERRKKDFYLNPNPWSLSKSAEEIENTTSIEDNSVAMEPPEKYMTSSSPTLSTASSFKPTTTTEAETTQQSQKTVTSSETYKSTTGVLNSAPPVEVSSTTPSYDAYNYSNEDDYESEEIKADVDNANITKSLVIVNYTNPEIVNASIFKCLSIVQSIVGEHKCDGIRDCEDGSDELFCTCKDRLAKVLPSAICNGEFDCEDRSDESDCHNCSVGFFNCKVSHQCIPDSFRCDGVIHCSYEEDEVGCLALSKDGIYHEGNETEIDGFLMIERMGSWSPACQTKNMTYGSSYAVGICSHLKTNGYENYRNETLQLEDFSCEALYVSCSKYLANEIRYYDSGQGDYYWPWSARILVDGEVKCFAVLLESDWLLASSDCMSDAIPGENYVVAKFGGKRHDLNIIEFWTQVIEVDSWRTVPDSDMIVLHLGTPAKTTEKVRPMGLPLPFIIPSNEEHRLCVAVSKKPEFLRPVFNCDSSRRCYRKMSSSTVCEKTSQHEIGVIVCQSETGWRPSSVFSESGTGCFTKNYSSFEDNLSKISLLISENPLKSSRPVCDGFRCHDGLCIEMRQVCNGWQDCPDAEDENMHACSLPGLACKVNEFQCKSGECIHKTRFHDGVKDCQDGGDEPLNMTCASYLKLAAPHRLCDGQRNCDDKTDEDPRNCSCSPQKFNCSRSDICIPHDFVCDGETDCPHGEDESACVGSLRLNNSLPREVKVVHKSFGVWRSLCSPGLSEDTKRKLCRNLGYKNLMDSYFLEDVNYVPELDAFSRIKLNNNTEIVLRGDRPFVTLIEKPEKCQSIVIKCT